jgi:hypothetical protein
MASSSTEVKTPLMLALEPDEPPLSPPEQAVSEARAKPRAMNAGAMAGRGVMSATSLGLRPKG